MGGEDFKLGVRALSFFWGVRISNWGAGFKLEGCGFHTERSKCLKRGPDA